VVPEPNVRVAAEFVTVTLFKDVAVATPNVGVVKVGAVNVLFVRVSTPANVAKVPAVGRVTDVAPVEVSVVANAPEVAKVEAARDKVAAEFVTVTLFKDVAVATPNVGVVNVGAVRVLFVRVSTPANVAKVPAVGSVTLVRPVDAKVVANAPV
jgi:flavoprotein